MRTTAFLSVFLACASWAHRVQRKRVQVQDRHGSAPAEVNPFHSEVTSGRSDQLHALATLLAAYNNPTGWSTFSSPVRKSVFQINTRQPGILPTLSEQVAARPSYPRRTLLRQNGGMHRRSDSRVSMADSSLEFSRTVTSSTIKNRRSTGITKILQNISATPEECAALAKRFGWVGITSLECTFHHRVVMPSSSRLRIRGTMQAEVETASLGKVKVEKARFEEWFKDYGNRAKSMPKMDVTKGVKTEFAELPLVEDRFDMGELCAQHLSLAIKQMERGEPLRTGWTT